MDVCKVTSLINGLSPAADAYDHNAPLTVELLVCVQIDGDNVLNKIPQQQQGMYCLAPTPGTPVAP